MASAELEKPTNLPIVSVIVPIYNGEADLRDLLQGLMAQTYTERVEYLLVDNGSVDRTPTLLQAAAQNQAMRHLSEPHIQSSYAARNVGMKAALGEALAFTDVDCRPQPQWLEQLMQPFENPAIGIVAGEVAALSGDSLLERFADRQNTLSQKHTLAHPFCPYGQTANLAVRRQAVEQVGLFRPYLTTGGDADLCWRIQQQTHWQLYYAEHAIVYHRHRRSIASLRQQWQRYGCSNRYLHELHGVPLMQPKPQDYLYRWGRWLFKELPLAATKVVSGRAEWLELLHTPLDLVCVQARASGQKTARLPDRARPIEWFEQQAKPPDIAPQPDRSVGQAAP